VILTGDNTNVNFSKLVSYVLQHENRFVPCLLTCKSFQFVSCRVPRFQSQYSTSGLWSRHRQPDLHPRERLPSWLRCNGSACYEPVWRIQVRLEDFWKTAGSSDQVVGLTLKRGRKREYTHPNSFYFYCQTNRRLAYGPSTSHLLRRSTIGPFCEQLTDKRVLFLYKPYLARICPKANRYRGHKSYKPLNLT
jgi:hypothetical protein